IDRLSAPACVSTAVSVGATTKDDQVADFSNVAPFLSLFAPGVSIISSFAGGGFAIASGTSMAAPHVAGTWAVLKQAKPTANVDEILQALTGTGVMIEDTLAGTGTTRPRIQVDLALSALLNPGVPIISGISPKRGTLGTSLTVTVNGINFEPGATASFGADVTVTSMTVVSSTQLSVALAIAATGTVSFGVADGGAFFAFASDLNPTVFNSGTGFTLTANFADGTSAVATLSLPIVPTISSVSPSTGLQGANLTVTVTGTNFKAGASAGFGAGITVGSTTVVSSTQLSVALAIGATAAMGPRDVTVSNPDGQSVVLTSGFTVTPPPP